MRTRMLVLGICGLLATPAHALIPAREAIGVVSVVLDEGTEIVRRNPAQVMLLRWTPELQARAAELAIAAAGGDLLSRIGADWVASVAGCWLCTPGGWPVLNLPCVEVARQAVTARLRHLYEPTYWTTVEASLSRLPTLWGQSPRPGEGAVIACVAGATSPPYQSLLPDPYYHQRPRPAYAPTKSAAEPPGDPTKEAVKELLLGGRPARVDGYQRIGYVVFLQTTGELAPHSFTAPVTGTCVQCVMIWCWPVTWTWTVTLQVLVPRAKTNWPAVAEGYGIPGLK